MEGQKTLDVEVVTSLLPTKAVASCKTVARAKENIWASPEPRVENFLYLQNFSLLRDSFPRSTQAEQLPYEVWDANPNRPPTCWLGIPFPRAWLHENGAVADACPR